MAEIIPVELDFIFDSKSYKKTPGNNVLETKFLSGPPQTRRRTTKRVDEHSGSFKVTTDQAYVFEEWYSSTLKDGSLSFSMNDPIYKTQKEFKFNGVYNLSHFGGDYWILNINLKEI